MSRRKGRIAAFQALYAWEATAAPLDELLEFNWPQTAEAEESKINAGTKTFASLLVAGTIENIQIIDEKIKENLQHWDFSRLKRVDVAILRISVYSLLFQPDIPPQVVMEEAVKISIEYGEDESFRFINGILNTIKEKVCGK
ncbi:N utilization substance protein B [Spirochaetia bacterium]|nr:N utilization substance protein B [Spirochaetia bacterium]